MEFDVSIVRRTCILLLEQLSDVASEINPLVRDEAMKVAGEWKEKMRAAVENSLEVLGLLHLLGAFRLAPAFDGNELESLLAIVAEDRQTPILCRSLGFVDKVLVSSLLLKFRCIGCSLCSLLNSIFACALRIIILHPSTIFYKTLSNNPITITIILEDKSI